MDLEAMMARLVQVGTVSNVDKSTHKVRCIMRETGMTSGWLYVLERPPSVVCGECGAALNVTSWFPKVNDQVMVISFPVSDGDGFVIGGI